MISTVEFTTYKDSIKEALDNIGAGEDILGQEHILIKPNLVINEPHPITTAPECTEAIIEYVRVVNPNASLIIAEGTGLKNMETDEVYSELGYNNLADKYDIELIDLNNAPLKKLSNPNFPVFPEIYLPEILFSHYIISVPVLKAHSLAVVTGSLKNMIGVAPPKYYSGQFGTWKKSVFHGRMQESIIDLCRYRKPDLSILDASIGLADFHLGGATCNPPVNKIVAGFDPREVDRKACDLLGFDWREIEHLVVDY